METLAAPRFSSGRSLAEESPIRAFHAYWRERAGARAWPRRDEIDPLDIPRLLPHLMILEPTTADGLRVRLAGTHLVNHLGADPTGGELRARACGEPFARVAAMLARTVVRAGAPAIASGRRHGADGTRRRVRHLMCPLSTGGERIDRLISCIVVAPLSQSVPPAEREPGRAYAVTVLRDPDSVDAR